MSDIKLFRFTGNIAQEIQGTASPLEKALQSLIELNLTPLMGIRFLASEYSTGKTHSGRIDTLGLDENHCPVIIEYKRTTGENVINQGLFYLDWLMDHKAEFKLMVLERYDKAMADAIDWSSPRLICIAADFTRYDVHAVQQINRNIDLVRYRRFAPDLLLLELVNSVAADPLPVHENLDKVPARADRPANAVDKPVSDWLADMPLALAPVFEALETYILSLGDDIQRKDLKLYVAFKRLRNFATVVFQKTRLRLFLHLDPEKIEPVDGLTRDVRAVGHWGTGDVEIGLGNLGDLERAKPFIQAAYEGGVHDV